MSATPTGGHRRRTFAVLGASFAVSAALWFGGNHLVDQRIEESDTQLGALDIRLTLGPGAPSGLTTDQILGDLDDELRHSSVAGTDGLLTATTADAQLNRSGSSTVDGCLAEVNLASARRFGPHPALSGGLGAPSRVRAGEVVLTEAGAQRLAARSGDTINVTVTPGASSRLRVAAIAPSVGALSLCDGIVADGELTDLGAEDDRRLGGQILLSADGAEQTDDATDTAIDALTAKFATRPWVEIEMPKVDRRRSIESTRAVWAPISASVAAAGVLLSGGLYLGARRTRRSEETQES